MAEGGDGNAAVTENRTKGQGFIAAKQSLVPFDERLKGFGQCLFFRQLIQFDPDENRMLDLPFLQDRQHALEDRKSTRLNSSHVKISYAVFCLKKKKKKKDRQH